MSAYQGLNTTQAGILIPRLSYIKIATKGFPFTNASGSFESLKLPLRGEKGMITYKSVDINDVTGAPNVQMFDVQATFPIIYTGNDLLQNLMLLSQDNCQALLADLNGNFFNWIAPAGTYTAPTATDFLSVGYKLSMPQKGDAKIEVILTGQLTDTELNELMVLSTSANAGGSSGTTNGLVTVATPGSIARPGMKSITANAVNMGEIVDSMLEISNVPIPGNKGKGFSREALVNLKFVTPQVNPTQIKGAVDHTQSRYQVIANRYNDDIWTFASGLRPKITDIKHGDDVAQMTIEMTAKYPYDFTNAITFPTLATPTFTQLGL